MCFLLECLHEKEISGILMGEAAMLLGKRPIHSRDIGHLNIGLDLSDMGSAPNMSS